MIWRIQRLLIWSDSTAFVCTKAAFFCIGNVSGKKHMASRYYYENRLTFQTLWKGLGDLQGTTGMNNSLKFFPSSPSFLPVLVNKTRGSLEPNTHGQPQINITVSCPHRLQSSWKPHLLVICSLSSPHQPRPLSLATKNPQSSRAFKRPKPDPSVLMPFRGFSIAYSI